jgi:hypothetical protein
MICDVHSRTGGVQITDEVKEWHERNSCVYLSDYVFGSALRDPPANQIYFLLL